MGSEGLPEEEVNPAQLGVFSSEQEGRIQHLSLFCNSYILRKLSGLAKEEETDAQ